MLGLSLCAVQILLNLILTATLRAKYYYPILQIRKLSPRKIKYLAWSHTAKNKWAWTASSWSLVLSYYVHYNILCLRIILIHLYPLQWWDKILNLNSVFLKIQNWNTHIPENFCPPIAWKNCNWFLTILWSCILAAGIASKSSTVNGEQKQIKRSEKHWKNKNKFSITSCD